MNERRLMRGTIGYNDGRRVLERLLVLDDLTSLLMTTNGGVLLHEVGHYIQVMQRLHLKYNAGEVRSSMELFSSFGAQLWVIIGMHYLNFHVHVGL